MTPASKTERVALARRGGEHRAEVGFGIEARDARHVLRRGRADVARREPDRQDEAAAAQRHVVGHAPVDVALAQDALLRDVVERERVVGVDALQPVFFVALDDRALRGVEIRIVREEKSFSPQAGRDVVSLTGLTETKYRT